MTINSRHPQLPMANRVLTDPAKKTPVWQKFAQLSHSLSAYHWVLLSQVFVVLPHSTHLPIWLVVYAFAVIFLQCNPIKRRLPNALQSKRGMQTLQFIGFFAGVAGLYFTYHTALGLDVGVAFLLLCAVSKLLELYTRRDAYVVLSLSLFVLAGLFLLDQGLVTTLEVIGGVMVVLFAMIAQNDDGSGRFRTLGILTLQAIPLMVILFLFFPRLPPLWSLKLSSNQTKTGMSDSMSPGDFAKLSQSTELAFRVEFTQPMPPRQTLYWRGLVFGDFDGKTWQPHDKNPMVWQPRTAPPPWLTQTTHIPDGEKLQSYHIILEKTGQPWLFGLDYPLPNMPSQTHQPNLPTQRGVGLTREFTLRDNDTVAQRFNYTVSWYPNAQIDTELSDADRQFYLRLPATGNPQSRQFAQALFQKVGNDPAAYVNALQKWITSQNFSYTLSPPPLPDDRIDGFLFGTRAGFCEHYASSFTYLMRAAGIPARVVAGYQGGQLGRDGKSWEVRQMDAHAWAEIWLVGHGWVRVDPTSFVSPERVEAGMDALTQTAGAKMFGDGVTGQISYQQFQLFQQTRRLFDQAGYYWQKQVVGYDQDSQQKSLLRWFNISSVYQQVLVMALGFSALLAVTVLLLWYKRRKVWDKADLAMITLSQRLAKANKTLARQESEGVLAWLERVEPALSDVTARQNLEQIKTAYRRYRYAQNDISHAAISQLNALSRKIKL